MSSTDLVPAPNSTLSNMTIELFDIELKFILFIGFILMKT